MDNEPNRQTTDAPLIHVGFAGSRRLFPAIIKADSLEPLHAEVRDYLTHLLRRLPERLGLPSPRLCSISALAAGGDTLFTQACAAAGIPQRLFLPQPRDEFLAACGDDGVPDFTNAERRAAEACFASPHVIEERVVSQAAGRVARFEETNAAILGASDVLVGLVRDGAAKLPGGTRDLLDRARQAGRPTLELCVTERAGHARITEQEWR